MLIIIVVVVVYGCGSGGCADDEEDDVDVFVDGDGIFLGGVVLAAVDADDNGGDIENRCYLLIAANHLYTTYSEVVILLVTVCDAYVLTV